MGVRSSSRGGSSHETEFPATAEDFLRYNNTTNRPVSLREEGASHVQTIPQGVCAMLDLDEGMTPSIFISPEVNAVTFVYD
jgi:hypothetical protein